jgi:hypothetical protein
MTIAAPFVLARRMRLVAGWQDLSGPAIAVGVLQIPLPILYGVFYGSSFTGYLNRAPLVVGSAGLVALALRVQRLALDRLA